MSTTRLGCHPDNQGEHQARLQGDVVLAKDAREQTPVTLAMQTVGPALLDMSLAENAAPDQRLHLPIQVQHLRLGFSTCCRSWTSSSASD